MTDGEKGKPAGSNLTAAQLRTLRRSEQRSSLGTLGISSMFLGFPDLELEFVDPKTFIVQLLTVVREVKPGSIISFYPESQPFAFGHPDHDETGRRVRRVAAESDVEDSFPESGSPLLIRPELWLQTFSFQPYDSHQYGLPITEMVKSWRNAHLTTHFPSQFSSVNERKWSEGFDQMTDNKRLVEGVVWDSVWRVNKEEVSGLELYRRER